MARAPAESLGVNPLAQLGPVATRVPKHDLPSSAWIKKKEGKHRLVERSRLLEVPRGLLVQEHTWAGRGGSSVGPGKLVDLEGGHLGEPEGVEVLAGDAAVGLRLRERHFGSSGLGQRQVPAGARMLVPLHVACSLQALDEALRSGRQIGELRQRDARPQALERLQDRGTYGQLEQTRHLL